MTGGLSCRGLVVAAGGAPILRGVDVEVASGSLGVVVGPSGAGKTTLLRAIGGLAPIEQGAVTLAGRDIGGLPAHERNVAVVFQEPRLLPHLSVVDNVALPLRAAGVAQGVRRRRAAALLDAVGLGGMSERAVQGLSGGEQQRVSLARAIVGDPDLLLLDEPLAAVDPNRREALRRLIARVQREQRLTTLLITHDRAEAAELGDTIAVMLEGRTVQHGTPRDVFERPRSAAVARFLGAVNLLRGVVRDGRLHAGPGIDVRVDGPDGPACFAIRPESVGIGTTGTAAVVTEATYAGTHVRVRVRIGELQYEAHVPPGTAVGVGAEVAVDFPRSALWRLPDDEPDAVGEPGTIRG